MKEDIAPSVLFVIAVSTATHDQSVPSVCIMYLSRNERSEISARPTKSILCFNDSCRFVYCSVSVYSLLFLPCVHHYSFFGVHAFLASIVDLFRMNLVISYNTS